MGDENDMTESQEELTIVRRLLASEREENAELKRENARLKLVLSGPHLVFETAKTPPPGIAIETPSVGLNSEQEHA